MTGYSNFACLVGGPFCESWEPSPTHAFDFLFMYARARNLKIRSKKKISLSTEIAASPLYQKVWNGFLKHNGGVFTNWPKERVGMRGLMEKSRARFGDDQEAGLISMCAAFMKLKNSGDKFWQGQPILPSTLNSSGIWDRVLETLRRPEIDPEVAALIGAQT